MKLAAILLGVGAVLLLLGLVLSLWGGASAMPSYLADWLFWSSLPIGALPLVMLLDLAGPRSGFGLEPVLRRLLLLMPVAALLLIPMLVRPQAVFGWAHGHGFTAPFGRDWMTQTGLVLRSLAYFALWILLALLFLDPPAPYAIARRRNIAAAGLFVFMLSATLAAADWAMAVEPAWVSAEFGLLLIAAQATIAISVALVIAGTAWRVAHPEAGASALLIGVGSWGALQFLQYLVIWSGDKPAEITWYLHRANTGSIVAVWIAVVCGVLLPFVLLHLPRTRARQMTLPVLALIVLCTQALGMLWLVTPSLRQRFIISGMDLLELAGIGAVMLGLFLWPGVWRKRAEAAHG